MEAGLRDEAAAGARHLVRERTEHGERAARVDVEAVHARRDAGEQRDPPGEERGRPAVEEQARALERRAQARLIGGVHRHRVHPAAWEFARQLRGERGGLLVVAAAEDDPRVGVLEEQPGCHASGASCSAEDEDGGFSREIPLLPLLVGSIV